MVFHGSLSKSKSTRVSKAILSILADLNNLVVRKSRFFVLFPVPSVSFPCLWGLCYMHQTTVSFNVTFMFRSIFCSMARFMYFFIFSCFFFVLFCFLFCCFGFFFLCGSLEPQIYDFTSSFFFVILCGFLGGFLWEVFLYLN